MGVPAITKLLVPTALTSTLTTNLYNPSANTFAIVRLINLANKTSGAVTVSLYLGLTGGDAAGTEILNGYSIPANTTYQYWTAMKVSTADFLTGGASANTSITITVMGELYAVQPTA